MPETKTTIIIMKSTAQHQQQSNGRHTHEEQQRYIKTGSARYANETSAIQQAQQEQQYR